MTREYPVALVAYNRPRHLARVIGALQREQAEPLYVFSDGPKGDHDTEAVARVRDVIGSVDWTEATVTARESNVGLRRSIVEAVDFVLGQHETVTLLEDDCVPGPHFLEFHARCLEQYRDDERILGICGYTVPVPRAIRERYGWDVYLYPRTGSWGWSTWRDRWELYRRDTTVAYREALERGVDLSRGGKEIPGYIRRAIAGELDIWTPGWELALAMNGMYYIYPTVSHVQNIGHDGSGLHCGKSDKYDTPIAETPPTRFPNRVQLDEALAANFRKHYRA